MNLSVFNFFCFMSAWKVFFPQNSVLIWPFFLTKFKTLENFILFGLPKCTCCASTAQFFRWKFLLCRCPTFFINRFTKLLWKSMRLCQTFHIWIWETNQAFHGFFNFFCLTCVANVVAFTKNMIVDAPSIFMGKYGTTRR